jgi:hypothetical protein
MEDIVHAHGLLVSVFLSLPGLSYRVVFASLITTYGFKDNSLQQPPSPLRRLLLKPETEEKVEKVHGNKVQFWNCLDLNLRTVTSVEVGRFLFVIKQWSDLVS